MAFIYNIYKDVNSRDLRLCRMLSLTSWAAWSRARTCGAAATVGVRARVCHLDIFLFHVDRPNALINTKTVQTLKEMATKKKKKKKKEKEKRKKEKTQKKMKKKTKE